MQLFYDFCKRDAAVLFATDVAARSAPPRPPPPRHTQHVANALSRGLDFPSVDWVVQFDCPESTATYIHRAGRTQTLLITRCNTLAVFLASHRHAFIQFFTRVQAQQGTTRRALRCSCWLRLRRRLLR
jgi:superfamily II DNA/RNA helicase